MRPCSRLLLLDQIDVHHDRIPRQNVRHNRTPYTAFYLHNAKTLNGSFIASYKDWNFGKFESTLYITQTY